MKRFICLIAILILAANSFAQGHFIVAFSGKGQDHMNITVVAATMGGIDLKSGDEIAAFDGTICCGKAILDGSIDITSKITFAAIAASREDEGMSNGYTIGDPISYKYWDSANNREISMVTAEYFDPETGAPIDAPTFQVDGSAFVKLSVPANRTPVANAGDDQDVNEGSAVTLDGSGSSDPDSDPLTYKWTAPTGITLSSDTDQKPTFTAPDVDSDTEYTFSLVVNDGTVDSPADLVKVIVKAVAENQPPVASAVAVPSTLVLNSGETATAQLDGSSSTDTDGTIDSYNWSLTSGPTSGATIQNPDLQKTLVSFSQAGVYLFKLTVTDDKGASDNTTVTVTVSISENEPPVAAAVATPSTLVLNSGETATAQLDGSSSTDTDGTIDSYNWSLTSGPTTGATIQNPNLQQTLVTFSQAGVYLFKLIVTDDKGASDNTTATVTVTIAAENNPPVASAVAVPSTLVLNSGETATAQLDGSSSTDTDGTIDSYNWSLTSGPTSGANIQNPDLQKTLVSFSQAGVYLFKLTVTDDKGATDNTTVTVTVTIAENEPPVAAAVAAPSTLVLNSGETATAQLDGSSSTDTDGTIDSYNWSLTSGPTSGATIQNPNLQQTLVTFSQAGVYLFKLTVTDDKGASDNITVTVTVTITEENNPPVAAAGADQTVNEGATVTLDGSASTDPDSDPLTYKWTAPDGITISSDTDQKPTFTAPDVDTDTEYTFSLVVNDGTVDSSADQVKVKVKAVVVNQPPVACAGPDQTVNEGDLVTLDGSCSYDPDNRMAFSWSLPGNTQLSSPLAIKVTVTGPALTTTTDYNFSLMLLDGTSGSTPPSIDWVVPAGVKFSSTTVSFIKITPPNSSNINYTYTVKVFDGSDLSDPNHNGMTYFEIPATDFIMSATTIIKMDITGSEATSLTSQNFLIEVSDATNYPEPGTVFLTQTRQIPSGITLGKTTVAMLTIVSPHSTNPDFQFTFEFNNGLGLFDPELSGLTYRWIAPPGITLSSETDPKPTFTAPEVNADTDYKFYLVVNDGTSDSPPEEVVVKVKHINKAPVANAGPDQAVPENTLVTLDGSGSSDPDNDALTYHWSAPLGITLSSPEDPKPTFIAPDVNANTELKFNLFVNDGTVDSPVDQVIITTQKINQAPTVNAGSDQSADENSLVTLDGSASTDPENDPLTYKWTAPSGIILNSETIAKPTFTAPEVSSDTDYKFTLVVNDGQYDSPADEIVVTVLQVNKAPVANTGDNQSVNEGAMATLDGSASSDADGDAITYKWTAPPGITLSLETDEKPTFTAPEVSADTQYTFWLVVNDGQADSPEDEVVITVLQINKIPTTNAGADQSVNEGATVTLDGSASSDPDGDALTYKWTAPPGITLSSDTDEKPTFTAPEVSADTQYTFSLVVNDGQADSAPDEVVITVLQVNKVPTANAGADQSVNEGATATLDGAASSDADGDALTYKWTAPTGITLSSDNEEKPTFTVPLVTTSMELKFTLVVNDGTIDSPADEVVITVENVDHAPYMKNVIADITVFKGAPDQVIDLTTIFADDDPEDVLAFSVITTKNSAVVTPNIIGNDLILSFSSVNTGITEVIVKASSNGKEVETSFKVEVQIPTSAELFGTSPDIQVYPNPTYGRVTLKFSYLPNDKIGVSVYDLTGKLVQQSLAESKQHSINLSGNIAGVYFIKIDQSPKVYKLVLK
ncbi:MAG TPA: hypothetical protein DHV48_09335 [Prolixibacteraceae bacterium]|nr:hypothetical protein [Prolixibacteraceae bacterium]